MLALFARIILKMMGWRITSVIPPDTKKCVIAVAPHTSYWDFVIGRLAYWVMGIKASFLIKKEAFRFPYRNLLKRMGGIPVDRGRGLPLKVPAAEKPLSVFRAMATISLEHATAPMGRPPPITGSIATPASS